MTARLERRVPMKEKKAHGGCGGAVALLEARRLSKKYLVRDHFLT